jgi:peptide chain release factor
MDETSLFLTSGNGPAECRAALSELIEILKVEAWNAGLRAEIALGPQPDAQGPKSAIVTLSGDGAQAFARRYCGTVQFIFKSRIRPGHKRQNWFVGVKPIDLAALEPASEDIRIEDLRFETLRAGGPGGQHQNTTDSAVRATHVPTGITVVCRDERSQHRNKALAIRRLAGMLDLLAIKRERDAKASLFLASKDLERGNAVRIFRL